MCRYIITTSTHYLFKLTPQNVVKKAFKLDHHISQISVTQFLTNHTHYFISLYVWNELGTSCPESIRSHSVSFFWNMNRRSVLLFLVNAALCSCLLDSVLEREWGGQSFSCFPQGSEKKDESFISGKNMVNIFWENLGACITRKAKGIQIKHFSIKRKKCLFYKWLWL